MRLSRAMSHYCSGWRQARMSDGRMKFQLSTMCARGLLGLQVADSSAFRCWTGNSILTWCMWMSDTPVARQLALLKIRKKLAILLHRDGTMSLSECVIYEGLFTPLILVKKDFLFTWNTTRVASADSKSELFLMKPVTISMTQQQKLKSNCCLVTHH